MGLVGQTTKLISILGALTLAIYNNKKEWVASQIKSHTINMDTLAVWEIWWLVGLG